MKSKKQLGYEKGKTVALRHIDKNRRKLQKRGLIEPMKDFVRAALENAAKKD